MANIDFLTELNWRGMLQDATPSLPQRLAQGQISAYVGIDPTAPSLHIGNLAPIMLLIHLQRAGHRPIILLGGATGMIGDPSGKAAERVLLDQTTVEANIQRIKMQCLSLLDYTAGPNAALILNNYDWYQHFKFLDFLRDVGKLITVNYMWAKDSVQNRKDSGISFTEFSYQLLQAYDFYYLYQHYQCHLQMGGSDQWGNITTGTELIRKAIQAEAHGLTCPLLTRADGSKFGKSEGGNIWLDPQMTSPYAFYQYWLNLADEEMPRMLRIFSLEGQAQIESWINDNQQQPEQRTAQKALAREMTLRIHGDNALNRALSATQVLFSPDAVEALMTLPEADFLELFSGVPTGKLPASALDEEPSVLEVLAQSGAQPSKGEAKRNIQAGAVRLNKVKVGSVDQRITRSDLLNDRYLLFQFGKKNYFIVQFTQE
jgi:tyrosyl-tRNA synthetase